MSVAALLFSPNARAAVTQPNGDAMPQPTGPAELNVITGRGFPTAAGTLAGLFMYHQIGTVAGGDMSIDPVKDAAITPGTFSPQCGLTGTIVMHGGSCKNPLGWYNATEPPTKPAANQIYQLVPGDLKVALMCMDNDFCPLATRITSQAPQHSWADPLPEFAGNIRTNPNWKGGQIGFALIGVEGSQCPQTKYSQAELNDKDTKTGKPWITTLIYHSVADPNAYYIAFEDIPTCTASWRGCTGAQPNVAPNGNDGDFNDFVFYVSGITCKDGGKPCTVPDVKGICAGGVTECNGAGMATTCRQAVMPAVEKCDGVDNDCNGDVDEGDLCGAGSICDHGTCVHPCDEDSEFKCVGGYKCDTDGYCKDPRCIGVKCGNDQVCIAGNCVGGCDGVVCPHNQVCRIGKCVEPCAGVTCDAGRICEDGACQPSCGDCRDCAVGRSCGTTGAKKGVCIETGCENKTCAAGEVCIAGACKAACDGVTCPAGQECKMGQCVSMPLPDGGITLPPPPPPPPLDSGVITGFAGNFGSLGTAGSNGTGTGGAGAGDPSGNGGGHVGGVKSCNCDTAEGPETGGVALMALLMAIAAARRARRAEAAVPSRRR
jgi:MYXO-CTERM domain-containing protein